MTEPPRRRVGSRAAALRIGETLFRELQLSIPTDLRVVARHLGAKVLEEPAPQGISGALVVKSGIPIIVANSVHSRLRRRFTIAHELGHLRMHVSDSQLGAEMRTVLFRDAKASQGRDLREIQANAFAAGVLMPEDEVRRIVRVPLDPFDEDEIVGLAREFDVSTDAIAVRLKDLGLWAA